MLCEQTRRREEFRPPTAYRGSIGPLRNELLLDSGRRCRTLRPPPVLARRLPIPRRCHSVSTARRPANVVLRTATAWFIGGLTVGRSAASRASEASGPSEGEGGESAARMRWTPPLT